jgi:hypothetical protein
MDKLTKKYLTKLISETYSGDVEEMARRKEDKRGDKKFFRFNPKWKDTNPTPFGGEGVPDAWYINPRVDGKNALTFDEYEKFSDEEKQKFKDEGIFVVPIDCEDAEEFLNRGDNRQWVESLEEKYEKTATLSVCMKRDTSSLPKTHRNMETLFGKGHWVKGEGSWSEQERIKRLLNSFVKKNFENESFSDILNKRSIPSIKANDRSHIDIYGEFSNQKIEYRTHSYNKYETPQEFLKTVIARIKGEDTPEMGSSYLARQYNKNYRQWVASKMMDKRYEGKTPVYDLNTYGLEEKNIDVTMRMDLEIFGEMIGDNSYSWNIKMTTKIGKKLTQETGLKGGFLDDKTLQSTTTAQIEPDTEFNASYTVMDNKSIVNALGEAIENLKSQIISIDPKETLKHASLTRKQINPLNESTMEKLIERIVQKILK